MSSPLCGERGPIRIVHKYCANNEMSNKCKFIFNYLRQKETHFLKNILSVFGLVEERSSKSYKHVLLSITAQLDNAVELRTTKLTDF